MYLLLIGKSSTLVVTRVTLGPTGLQVQCIFSSIHNCNLNGRVVSNRTFNSLKEYSVSESWISVL